MKRPRRARRALRRAARAPRLAAPELPRPARGVCSSAAPRCRCCRWRAARAETPRAPAPAENDARARRAIPTRCEYWRHCAIDGFLCAAAAAAQTALSAGHRDVARHLDRHLPQSRRRQGLHHLVQRLLREGLLRALRLQPQRGRPPRLPPGTAATTSTGASGASSAGLPLLDGDRRRVARPRPSPSGEAPPRRSLRPSCWPPRPPRPSRRPEEDYVLECSGCHRLDGSGAPGVVPPLCASSAPLLATPGGRAYLVRVPGVAQAPLDDERLARLLNFVLRELAASPALPPYGPEEVGRLRRSPLRDPRAERARLVPPALSGR